ncbi:hypothetical protein ACLOJK_041444 [Asimina triloba]
MQILTLKLPPQHRHHLSRQRNRLLKYPLLLNLLLYEPRNWSMLEPSQDSLPEASPSTLATEVHDSTKKPPTFYIRKRAKTSPEEK